MEELEDGIAGGWIAMGWIAMGWIAIEHMGLMITWNDFLGSMMMVLIDSHQTKWVDDTWTTFFGEDQ